MENFNLIGNFTGKLFNNFAHAQAVSSRPCGGLVKEATTFPASFTELEVTKKIRRSIKNRDQPPGQNLN